MQIRIMQIMVPKWENNFKDLFRTEAILQLRKAKSIGFLIPTYIHFF